MIIIIEGADGSGKTTLANQISRQTGWPIIHRSHPKSEEEKAQMFKEYQLSIKAGKNIIFDRCWYSELAYGPAMRDKSVISFPEMYELERGVVRHGGILIYCNDKPEVLWQRCQKRGETYITSYANFVEICKAYDEIIAMPHYIPVMTYGYKDL